LNTELGFVIDSPALAGQLADAFVERIPERAYRVRLETAGRLQWTEKRDGDDFVYDREPGAGFGLRLVVAALAVLPIEWLL
jgi:putative cardiolipin synthase